MTTGPSTRDAIAAALWPDLDVRAASNNLAVTLNHLLQLLDPGRHSRDPSYLLRLDGPNVRLVTGEHLRVDVDEFDRHLAAADRAGALARRALAVDQWNEDAYAILVVVALARGDRSAAQRWLTRCLDAVADLGLQPSDATLQLRRRLHGTADHT